MRPLWLIDLDDTLFEASAGMLHAIHLRMNDYIVAKLGLSWDEASALRRRYWAQYGATFLGLWRHHDISPREFLPATHDFDPVPFIHWHGTPSEDLSHLSGRKVIYTNGPRIYAERVVTHLGLTHVIDDLVTSTDTYALNAWHPKPSRLMLRILCRRYGVESVHATLVDDGLQNLLCAHSEGLKTVCCTGYRKTKNGVKHRRAVSYVDFNVSHIRELSRLPIFKEKNDVLTSVRARSCR